MRLVIAEDSAILREGLVQLLVERGHDVVANVGIADELVEAVIEFTPDVVVVDIRMPPTFTGEGLVAAVALRRSHPDVGVLVFSQWVETRYATELLAGNPEGVGYLLKDGVTDIAEFDSAVRRVAAGGTALDPEVVRQLIGSRRQSTVLDRLTPREREVLELMAEGIPTAPWRSTFRSPSGPSKGTSRPSSPNWTCRRRRPSTAACSRS
jgi:DNA-binding NarL/FixJ family response regulator